MKPNKTELKNVKNIPQKTIHNNFRKQYRSRLNRPRLPNYKAKASHRAISNTVALSELDFLLNFICFSFPFRYFVVNPVKWHFNQLKNVNLEKKSIFVYINLRKGRWPFLKRVNLYIFKRNFFELSFLTLFDRIWLNFYETRNITSGLIQGLLLISKWSIFDWIWGRIYCSFYLSQIQMSTLCDLLRTAWPFIHTSLPFVKSNIYDDSSCLIWSGYC